MGTVEQMRRWLRGSEDTPYGSAVGAPEATARAREAASRFQLSGVAGQKDGRWKTVYSANGQYSTSVDGKDGVLHFGKHSGSRISELADSKNGRSYLKWMLGPGNFNDKTLTDIVRYQMAEKAAP